MLPSLHRWTLLDLLWDRVAFDDLAEFWARTFAQERPAGATCTTCARLRVWGSPRAVGGVVAAEVAQRLGEAGVPVKVSMPDADTVQVEANGPLLGALVAALDVPAARELVVEVSLALADPDEERAPVSAVGNPTGLAIRVATPDPVAFARAAVLVAVGEARDGRVRVRGLVAHRGLEPNPKVWSENAGTEAHLLGAFETFRHSRTVAVRLLPRLLELGIPQPEPPGFSEDAARTTPRRLGATISVVLAPFLVAGLLVAGFDRPPKGALPFLLIVGVTVCVNVASAGRQKWQYGYAAFKQHYDALFLSAARYALVDPEPVRALSSEEVQRLTRELATVGLVARPADPLAAALNDVVVRKVTADLVDAGFVHDGDAAAVPHAEATAAYRFFRAPDGRSYLAVGFSFGWVTAHGRAHTWPASVILVLCQTFFADGTRLETCNRSDPLCTLGRGVPTATWHTVPSETSLLECYARHQKLLAERMTASESQPLKPVPPERFVALQNDISAEQYEAYWRRPYGPRDHLWWYLGYDRPN